MSKLKKKKKKTNLWTSENYSFEKVLSDGPGGNIKIMLTKSTVLWTSPNNKMTDIDWCLDKCFGDQEKCQL